MKTPLRTIFLGTPRFAELILADLIAAGQMPVGVITQADQPAGRGKKLTPPPVKVLAQEHALPLWQPRAIGDKTRQWIRDLNPDICIAAAYGKILTRASLDTAPLGFLNAHASLLPRYRGAAPVPWAIANGESETGVSVMQLDEGMDTGDVLLQHAVPILDDDTTASVLEKLAHAGAPLLIEAMDQLAAGTANPKPQASFDDAPTHAPMLTKQDGQIDWAQPARQIFNRMRGMSPWPGAFTTLDDKLFKILVAEPTDEPAEAAAGTITAVDKKGLLVATGQGALLLLQVQLQGKKAMPANVFSNGYRLKPGTQLGNVNE